MLYAVVFVLVELYLAYSIEHIKRKTDGPLTLIALLPS